MLQQRVLQTGFVHILLTFEKPPARQAQSLLQVSCTEPSVVCLLLVGGAGERLDQCKTRPLYW